MSWFKDLGIRWKLIGSFGVVLGLMGVVGAVAVMDLNAISADLHRVADQEMEGVEAALSAKLMIMTIQAEQGRAALSSDADARQRARTAIEAAERRYVEQVKRLEAVTHTDDGRAHLADLGTAWTAWGPIRTRSTELATTARSDEAAALLTGADTVRTTAALAAAVDGLVDAKQAEARRVALAAEHRADRAGAIVAALMVAALAAGLGLALLVSSAIVRAVGQVQATLSSMANNCAANLERSLEAMSRYDLTVAVVPVTKPVAYQSRDEIGRTAEITNVMLARLQSTIESYEQTRANLADLVRQIQGAATGVSDSSSQLGQASGESAGVVQQVTAVIQNVTAGAQQTSEGAMTTAGAVDRLSAVVAVIGAGADEQAQKVDAASATASQMAAGVEQVARNADNVAATTEQTRASAQDGARAVNEAVVGMSEIREVVAGVAGRVSELGALGSRIGAVVETIDDIAEQTNLLALNAAIEAARAGEHGRGFAVVADEVRKLAERSQRETKAISELIEDVQRGTREAVAAMDSGTAKVEAGAARADQARQALSVILNAVDATVDQVSDIATAAQEMAAGARQMVTVMEGIRSVAERNAVATEEIGAEVTKLTDVVQSIAAVAEENSAATEEVSASAEEMSAQVEEISAQAQELAATAEQLRELAGRFLLEAQNVQPLRQQPRPKAA